MVFQEEMQYRVNHIISFLCVIFPLIGIALLWETIYTENNIISGYTKRMMITYYILSAFLEDLVLPVVWLDIAFDIRRGTLSNYLLRPISYKLHFFCVKLSSSIIYTITSLPIIIIFVLIFNLNFQFPNSLLSFLLFFLTSLLSLILSLNLTYLLSLSAFWLEENTGMLYFVNFVIPILAGMILPLDLFPLPIYKVMNLLPFKYLLFFPINIFLEKMAIKEIMHGISIQLIWLAIIHFITNFVWYRGTKRYTAYGG